MHRKTAINALVFLAALPIPSIIFYCAFSSTAFDIDFYNREFAGYDAYGQLEGHNVDRINANVLDYISGKERELDDLGLFSEREKSHLHDVRELIGKLKAAAVFSAALFMFFSFFLAFLLEFGIKKFLEKELLSILVGSAIAFIISSILIFLFIAGFGFLFDGFHNIFFAPGTFSFDPQSEKIVVIYPEELFFDASAIILMKLIFSSAIIIISCLALLRAFFGCNFPDFFQEKFRR